MEREVQRLKADVVRVGDITKNEATLKSKVSASKTSLPIFKSFLMPLASLIVKGPPQPDEGLYARTQQDDEEAV